ncbi:MAG: DUF512 domain-containing protein [Clostridia bacterium]
MPKIKVISKFAKKLGLNIGDDVVSIGGYPMLDELDYIYFDGEKNFDIEFLRGGEKHKIHIKKDGMQPLGLEFEIEMKPYLCKNKCIFCFVDQLPKGLRDTLYVKDDDYRFSFISGSYVTLTNVSEDEINRIIRLKLSPLYISVHAFDDEIRLKMLRNPNTLKLKEYMKKLGNAGIKMHTQLVVVPGVNDGKVLEDSIRGLHGMKNVETCAVVPVGLTCHREKLDNLPLVSVENAVDTIKLVEKLHTELNGFCWCADEYYVKAGENVKDFAYYGAFEQIENGVGLLADFFDNLDYSLSTTKNMRLGKKVAFATGVSFAPILKQMTPKIEAKLGIKCEVCGIENNFFGKTVTVAGLVTAGDIMKQMQGVDCDAIILPDNMLREFTDMFLDNIEKCEVEKALNKKIVVVSHSGSDLIEKLAENLR